MKQRNQNRAAVIGSAGSGQYRTICRGRKPFGSRAEETVVITKMRELRARGLGFDRIAEALNDDRIPSRDGKAWHGLVVNRILARALSSMTERFERGANSS